ELIKTKQKMALCRCGASKTKPFCDGTHAAIGFTDEKSPERQPDQLDEYVNKSVKLSNRPYYTLTAPFYCDYQNINVEHLRCSDDFLYSNLQMFNTSGVGRRIPSRRDPSGDRDSSRHDGK
ncbi:MAG: hypothetical protein D6732_18920, partial [Methanobacteriota archaeon]